MTDTTSDVTLSTHSSIRAVFHCDGKTVTVSFHHGEKQLSPPKTFSRANAVKHGKRAEETGLYDYLPIDLPSDCVRTFGKVLKRYGEKGC